MAYYIAKVEKAKPFKDFEDFIAFLSYRNYSCYIKKCVLKHLILRHFCWERYMMCVYLMIGKCAVLYITSENIAELDLRMDHPKEKNVFP